MTATPLLDPDSPRAREFMDALADAANAIAARKRASQMRAEHTGQPPAQELTRQRAA